MEKTLFKLLVLKSPHPATLKAFYQVLGLEFQQEQHGQGPIHHYANLGDLVLELYPLPAGSTPDTSMRLGFAVGDLEGVIKALQVMKVEIVQFPQQTPWGLRGVVKDPDGRAIELYPI